MKTILVAMGAWLALTCAAMGQGGPGGAAPMEPVPGPGAGIFGSFTAGDIILGGPGSTQVQDATQVFTGTSQSTFHLYAPNVGSALSLGTSGSPITTAGPLLKLSKTEQIANTSCNSNSVDNECNATLALYSVGTASDGMQVNALYASAQGSSTTTGDEVAINAIGRVTGSGIGIGTGSYLEGRADTSTGKFIGAEIRANNQTGSSYTYSTSGFSSGSLWLTAASSLAANLVGHGVALGSVSSAQFDVGFAATSGSVKTTTFQDDSSSTTSIQINGSHATAQIAGTGFSFDASGNESVTRVNVTGSSAPTNGIYLPGSNIVGFASNGSFSAAFNGNRFLVGAQNAQNVSNGSGAPIIEWLGSAATSSVTGMLVANYRAATTAPAALYLGQANTNSVGSYTAVASGTQLGMLMIEGADGTNFRDSSQIRADVDAAVSTGIVPGRLVFSTANASGTLTEAFRVTSGQQIQYPGAVTGTPAASLCIDASNNIIKKTTTGSCV